MRAAGDQIIIVCNRYRWKFFEQIVTVAYVKSSHQKCSVKTRSLENFANFTGKYLRWSLFLIKFQAWGPENVFKKTTTDAFFTVKFAKFFRAPILEKICEQLCFSIFT